MAAASSKCASGPAANKATRAPLRKAGAMKKGAGFEEGGEGKGARGQKRGGESPSRQASTGTGFSPRSPRVASGRPREREMADR